MANCLPSAPLKDLIAKGIKSALAHIDRIAAHSAALSCIHRLEQAALAKTFHEELLGGAADEIDATLAGVPGGSVATVNGKPMQLGMELV